MKHSLLLTAEEIKTLLTCVNDYRWVGDFTEDELFKIKRKLKYYLNKGN